MLYPNPRYYFTHLPRILSSALLPTRIMSVICVSSRAQQMASTERKVESGAIAEAEEERKSLGNKGWMLAPPKAVIKARTDGGERQVEIKSEEQYEQGNVTVAVGNVHVSDGHSLD